MGLTGLGLAPKPDYDPWVDGKTLIVPRGKSLLNRCVACGEPAQVTHRREFTYYPNEAASFLGGILGGIPGWFASTNAKETFSLEIPVCVQHETSFRRRRRISAIVLAVAILLFVLGVYLSRPVLSLSGFLIAPLAGAVFAYIKPCPRLRATLINDSLAEFSGASSGFLNQVKTGKQ